MRLAASSRDRDATLLPKRRFLMTTSHDNGSRFRKQRLPVFEPLLFQHFHTCSFCSRPPAPPVLLHTLEILRNNYLARSELQQTFLSGLFILLILTKRQTSSRYNSASALLLFYLHLASPPLVVGTEVLVYCSVEGVRRD